MNDLYIDIGSTNIKWRLGEGMCRSVSFPRPVVSDGVRFEVNPGESFSVIARAIADAAPGRIFIATQMHGYVLLQNGCEATNYISWRDTRAASLVTSATPLAPAYGTRVKANLPRLSVQTGSVAFDEFCSLGSYIARKLTGVNASHITDLAATGFYNVSEKCADSLSFALPTAFYGSVEALGRTKSGAEVFAPVGDQQASIRGALATLRGSQATLILNLGTAAQMCVVADSGTVGDFESRPYFRGRTLCTVTGLFGGGYLAKRPDDTDALADALFNDWHAALDKLPAAPQLLVTGGVVIHRRPLLDRVLPRLGLPLVFDSTSDALEGLRGIADA